MIHFPSLPNVMFRHITLIILLLTGFSSIPVYAKDCSTLKIQKLTEQIGTKKAEVSFSALSDSLSHCDSTAVTPLTNLLKSSNPKVRWQTTILLGRIGEEARIASPTLTKLLLNDRDSRVRSNVAIALGNIAPKDETTISALLKTFQTDPDPQTRADAVYGLGRNSGGEPPTLLALTAALESNDDALRRSILDALYEIGKESEGATQASLKILQNASENTELRYAATTALVKISSGDERVISALVDVLQKQNPRELRSRATDTLRVLARSIQEKASTLSQIEDASKRVQKIHDALTAPEYEQNKQSVNQILVNLEGRKTSLLFASALQWMNNAKNVWFAHAAFWLILVLVYPRSSQVQAIFFWNPWVRNILGVWYVPLALTWVPFLRRKLFEPFQVSLLADARLSQFDPQSYFSESGVKSLGSHEVQSITNAIPAIAGQIVLEGDSGLGKSMFLRHLVQRSNRITVFLPARKCENGVIEAIQAKLHGQAQDAEFLKNLIYSGAIDICIDGLNEVTADTRAKITQFVESYFKGNIFMTTQPLEWIPPSTAKIYQLQPLRGDQIEAFLLSRKGAIVPSSPTDYERSCHAYLAEALSEKQYPEELATNQRILSNPMDLSVVAQMIEIDKKPDLFRLQEQQYRLMAAEYQQEWNREFPLKKFSEAVYELRLNDEKALPHDQFYAELCCMEDDKYKMVVSRQWKDATGEPHHEWYFRHDKIMEFFIVQTFLGSSDDARNRLMNHIGDPRFRGVYFLLATLLSIEAAQDLREKLIQYAADTKDHTVSDTFVQLLRSRTVCV